jgi:hypothetical protein
MRQIPAVCGVVLAVTLLSSCGGGGSDEGDSAGPDPVPPNTNVDLIEVTLHLDEPATITVDGVTQGGPPTITPRISFDPDAGASASATPATEITAEVHCIDELGNDAPRELRISLGP